MFSMLFGPSIEVDDQRAIISGLSWRPFEQDVNRLYGTTTITKYMLSRVNSRKFEVKSFFLLELNHLITKLLQLKSTRVNRRDLVKVQELIQTETWVQSTLVPQPSLFDMNKLKRTVKLKPLDPQLRFLETYTSRKASYHLKGLLLDGKAGSGKTALSLMWSESLPKGKTVGFVPLNVIEEVWANHMTNNIKHEVWVKPPKFWHSKMDRPPQKDDEYYFVHYEFMLDPLCEKYMRMIHSFNTGNPAFKMIVDECHNFNDPNSKRTKKLIEYNEVYGFTDALPMSGTPIKGVGKESYTIFCLIDSFFKGNVRKAFLDGYGRSRDKLNELLAHRIGAEKYTIAVLDGMGDAPAPERVKVKVPNAEHFTLDSIRNQMQVYIQDRYKYYSNNMEQYVSYFNDIISGYRAHCIKRNDQKALSELDEYLRIVNKFRKDGYNNFTDSDLSKRAKEIELDIEEWMRPTERKHFRNAKSIVKYVGLKIQGEALGNVLGKARIEAVKALVEHADLPSYIDHVEKKTLIFTDHVDVVYECDDHLTKQGYDTIFVYGNNTSERDKLVAQFGESETKNPLITTFKSLSTGYPLLMANQVLCMNAPWRDYTLTQTIARVHRQGQTAPTFAYMFELDTNGRENVTGRNLDIMQWSREQVAQIMSVQHGEDVTLVGVAGTEDLFDADHTLWDESVTPPKVVTHVSPMGLF
ncbi:DNA helicase [Vibrio phage Aphrodite1]|uniref:DNA helicase n=1 Tax=Vibrio phage Aphrodite1 TaxID=2070057 RepID=A0A2I7QHR2_9CAUD|nr:DNA helicase [Vibrio phage Aphrodite1]AUR80929.1 DNA helicase [Vibrio phage Aphrodite1]